LTLIPTKSFSNPNPINPRFWKTINSEDIVAIQALPHSISTYAKGKLPPIVRLKPKPPKEWIVLGYSNSVKTLAIVTRDKKYLVSIPTTEETAKTLRELYNLPNTPIEPPPEKSQ
jgi:hypothetical protein